MLMWSIETNHYVQCQHVSQWASLRSQQGQQKAAVAFATVSAENPSKDAP